MCYFSISLACRHICRPLSNRRCSKQTLSSQYGYGGFRQQLRSESHLGRPGLVVVLRGPRIFHFSCNSEYFCTSLSHEVTTRLVGNGLLLQVYPAEEWLALSSPHCAELGEWCGVELGRACPQWLRSNRKFTEDGSFRICCTFVLTSSEEWVFTRFNEVQVARS